MDTRRLSESIEEPPRTPVTVERPDVEIVELTAVVRPTRARRFLPRVLFVVGVAILASLIAWAGFPSRTSFAFDKPLPNVFTSTPAP